MKLPFPAMPPEDQDVMTYIHAHVDGKCYWCSHDGRDFTLHSSFLYAEAVPLNRAKDVSHTLVRIFPQCEEIFGVPVETCYSPFTRAQLELVKLGRR